MVVFNDSSILNNYSAFITKREIRGQHRETLELHFRQMDHPDQELSFQWLKNRFKDGTQVSIRETVYSIDQNGQESESFRDYSYAEFTLAGPITDNADGTYIVCLCKKTDAEELEELNAELILKLGGAAVE